MLKKLTIGNFKSWRGVQDLKLGKLNGFFGTNSSGKSSIAQALLVMKQTAESSDRSLVLNLGDDKSPVNLGTFRDVLHAHETKTGELTFGVEFDLPETIEVVDPGSKDSILMEGKSIGFRSTIQENARGRLSVKSMTYDFAGHYFRMRPDVESSQKYKLESDFKFKKSVGRKWDLPAPQKFYGFPDQVKGYYQNAGFLSDMELFFEQFLSTVYYLGPLREFPKREYTWAGGMPPDMGQRGELAVHALLASRSAGKIGRGKGRDRFTVEEYVAHWLRELGLIYAFRVEAVKQGSNLYQVFVQRNKNSSEVLITDVGFGVSQILPVIALCYYVPRGSTIILEQPEIHLHPSVQSGLADVFIDAMEVRGVQFIIESHSEHLLRRLQRRVAEGRVASEEMALHFCRAKNGHSQLEALRMDLFGRIQNWPEGFFGDEFEEIAATTEAIARRAAE